jgi:glycosyltransferase involved in cell wall biosynthesis
MKTVLFLRHFEGPTGGHVKVYHYLQHVLHSGAAQPRLYLTPSSVRESSNFFLQFPDFIVETVGCHDALFLGGVDWPTAEGLDLLERKIPIIALLQNVCHANTDDPYRRYNHVRASRICNGQEVADAILSLGEPNGPLHVITAAFPLLDFLRVEWSQRTTDVFIAGYKNPHLAEATATRLASAGITVDLTIRQIPSKEYHSRMARARVAITLLYRQEGSPLPPLAAMGLGVAVVCTETVGIHDICRADETALLPPHDADALADAARRLLDDQELCARLRANARKLAELHTLEREFALFLPILHQALGDAPDKDIRARRNE